MDAADTFSQFKFCMLEQNHDFDAIKCTGIFSHYSLCFYNLSRKSFPVAKSQRQSSILFKTFGLILLFLRAQFRNSLLFLGFLSKQIISGASSEHWQECDISDTSSLIAPSDEIRLCTPSICCQGNFPLVTFKGSNYPGRILMFWGGFLTA